MVSSVLYVHRSSRVGTTAELAPRAGLAVDDGMRADVVSAEKTYLEAANGFLAEFDSGKTLLAPEARKIFDGNLAITDQAISDVKLALKERPSDPGLARKLLATHERRIELLQQATHLSFAARNGG